MLISNLVMYHSDHDSAMILIIDVYMYFKMAEVRNKIVLILLGEDGICNMGQEIPQQTVHSSQVKI